MLNKFLFLSTLATLSIIGIAADETPITPSTTTEIIQETLNQSIDLVANCDKTEGSDNSDCGCDGACGCNKTV